jgi:integrase
VGVFLAALKLFYSAMREMGCYADEHPLVDVAWRVLAESAEDLAPDDDRPPRMPDVSGVEAPSPRRRLTDSYFKLIGTQWVPRVIDDPGFPAQVLTAGRTLRGWGLREDCVTRLLFETGGRISEVTGLMLGDWVRRGLTREVAAASKGSRGRRVKFLRFSTDTATLLRRYVDRERPSHDPDGCTLADYLRRAEGKLIDLNAVPLFLTSRGTPLTAKGFRDARWIPACRAAGIDADPHQARHWYVTIAVRAIYETSGTQSEVQRRLLELIEYMQWRGGQETMAAYEHYFDAARHAEIQDQLHERLRAALADGLERPQRARRDEPLAPAPARAVDPDLAFLRALGGAGA